MIIDMLTGVSEMLDMKDSDIVKDGIVKVKCAKIMLDKIIDGMQKEHITIKEVLPPQSLNKHSKPHRPEVTSAVNEPDYLINVDQGKLIDIKVKSESGLIEIEPDLVMEVNGKITTYAQAKGQPFQSGRII